MSAPDYYKTAMTEAYFKTSILGKFPSLCCALLFNLTTYTDLAKYIYGHQNPAAQDWAVIVASSDTGQFIAKVITYVGPNYPLSRVRCAQTGGPSADRISALGDLLAQLERKAWLRLGPVS